MKTAALVLVSVLGLVLGLALLTPPAAVASDDGDPCQFYVTVQKTFVIGSAAGPRLHLHGDCTYADSWFASGKLLQRNGSYLTGSRAEFDGCYAYQDLDCYETEINDSDQIHLTKPGTYSAVAFSGLAEDYINCYDSYYCFYDVRYGKARPITAKYGAAAGLAIVKSANGRRTFQLAASHYSTTAKRMVRSKHTEVVLQRKTSGGWITQARLKTTTSGVAVFSKKIGKRSWRAYVPQTPTRWGGHSSIHTV